MRGNTNKGLIGYMGNFRDEQHGRTVEFKALPYISDEKTARQVLREIRVLRCLSSDHVACLERAAFQPDPQHFGRPLLMFELMDTTFKLIANSRMMLSEEHQQFFNYQMMRGLKYIHSAGLVLGTISAESVMIDRNEQQCFAQMNEARLAGSIANSQVSYSSDRRYLAPEVLLGQATVRTASDMWAAGCVMLEMLERRVAFAGDSDDAVLTSITHRSGRLTPEDLAFIADPALRLRLAASSTEEKLPFTRDVRGISASLLQLVDLCLEFNPDRRITACAALLLPCFTELHEPIDEPEFAGELDLRFEAEPLSLRQLQRLVLAEMNLVNLARRHEPIDISLFLD